MENCHDESFDSAQDDKYILSSEVPWNRLGSGCLPAGQKRYTDPMTTIETYSDGTNQIVITTTDGGVTVAAQIRTKPPYTGGSDVGKARGYAMQHGLTKI